MFGFAVFGIVMLAIMALILLALVVMDLPDLAKYTRLLMMSAGRTR